jgi:ribosomal protein S18 acetylase RimI-like enzyme
LAIRTAISADCDRLGQISADRNGGSPQAEAETFWRQIRKAEETGDLVVMLAEVPATPEPPVAERAGAAVGGRIVAFARAGFHRWLKPEDETVPEGGYLLGIVVVPGYRRAGIARALTLSRLEWLRCRTAEAYYFADSSNRVSIAMHAGFGFEEIARNIAYPGVAFTSGVGVLFRARLTPPEGNTISSR